MCKGYDVINSKIMELLEQGTVPWRKTWNVATNQPKNLISLKEYRGINVFMLACMPFASPYWLTFKQCSDLKGQVRKGMKSTPVVFWKWFDRKDAEEGAEVGEVSRNGKIPMLRYYNLFNLDQVKGIEPPSSTVLHISRGGYDPSRTTRPFFSMPLLRHRRQQTTYLVKEVKKTA